MTKVVEGMIELGLVVRDTVSGHAHQMIVPVEWQHQLHDAVARQIGD